MQRTSLRYFYRLGQICHPLTTLEADQKIVDVWSMLNDANQALTGLFTTDNFVARALRSSWEPGPALQTVLKKFLTITDWDKTLDFMETHEIQTAAKEFETIFTGELHFADAYFVTQKGGLDTVKIITDGSVLFPADLSAKVPDAIGDVKEAGKCIAFELGTAAGFHLLRAAETVMRKYYDVVSKGQRRPNARSIAAYLKAMEKLNVGEPKVLTVLDQIRTLHRNPLAHPEDDLTVEDALNLWGIVRSAIAAMLKTIPMPPLSLTPQLAPETGSQSLIAAASSEDEQPS